MDLPSNVTPDQLERSATLAIELVYGAGTGDHSYLRAGAEDSRYLIDSDLELKQQVTDQLLGLVVGTAGPLTTFTADRQCSAREIAAARTMARQTHLIHNALASGDSHYRDTAIAEVRALDLEQLQDLLALTLAAAVEMTTNKLREVGWPWPEWRRLALMLLATRVEQARRDRSTMAAAGDVN